MTAAYVSATATTGSANTFYSDAVTTVAQIKGTKGQIYGFKVINNNAAVAYLQWFWLPSASVSLGTTVPNMVYPLISSEEASFFPVIPIGCPPLAVASQGIANSGLSVACTTTAGGSTAGSAKLLVLYY